MTPKLAGLTLAMPAYDEEANVERAIEAALEAGKRFAEACEVVVVDDGSRDATAARVEAMAGADPRIRLVRHDRNRGYGAAVRSGLRAATMPFVFYTDADLQFDLGQVGELAEPLARHDVVVGYRADRHDSALRRWNGEAWSWLQRRLFGLEVRDVDCAFKIFRREVLEDMPIESDGAFVSSEILLRALAAGHSIGEIPVRHFPRQAGEASGARPLVIARAFVELVRFRLRTFGTLGRSTGS